MMLSFKTSKYIKDIINDINTNPESYNDYKGFGLEKDNILIYKFGNGKMISLIDVEINGNTMPTTYIDLWKLESTIKNWYRTISLTQFNK